MNFSKIRAAFKISLAISITVWCFWQLFSYENARADSPRFPTWGNVCRYGEPTRCIADCVFASVANWEILALHRLPDEATVEIAFSHAGGSPVHGIYVERAERWLHRVGLEGIRFDFRNVFYPPLEQMKRWIRHYHYLLAGWGDHEVTINGVGPKGPRYVTYGYEAELTWAEANTDLEELTEVSVAKEA